MSTEAIIQNSPQKSMIYHLSMVDHPLILQGVYSSILSDNFHSKMQKNSTCLSTGKNSTARLKNSTDVSAPSARFSNYAFWSQQLQTTFRPRCNQKQIPTPICLSSHSSNFSVRLLPVHGGRINRYGRRAEKLCDPIPSQPLA